METLFHTFYAADGKLLWCILLTHLSLASLLWDIGKQTSPRCGSAASHLGLFCLL